MKNQLNLFLDEKGLLRYGGRLQHADIPYATKYPLILPRNHTLTTLIMQDSHIRVCHNGVKETLKRQGLPLRFLSDNGKTFKAAASYIANVFKDGAVQDHLSVKGSDRILNVERALRSTKSCLKKMVGRANLTTDELLTAVVEIEAVINSRPLSWETQRSLQPPLT